MCVFLMLHIVPRLLLDAPNTVGLICGILTDWVACPKACVEFQQEIAKPALKVRCRRDVHNLPQSSAGCLGYISYSCLPERGPSTRYEVMPHTFGRLLWASVSAYVANQSGLGSPGQITWEQDSPPCSLYLRFRMLYSC